MNSKGQMDGSELKIQSALGAFLRSRKSLADYDHSDHLDEDVMTAFVEGGLSEAEAGPITFHLTNCSFCRHVSAELIKLDAVFAEAPPVFETPVPEPNRVGEVLKGVLSRIFGGSDAAVFAHEEKEKDENKEPEEKE